MNRERTRDRGSYSHRDSYHSYDRHRSMNSSKDQNRASHDSKKPLDSSLDHKNESTTQTKQELEGSKKTSPVILSNNKRIIEEEKIKRSRIESSSDESDESENSEENELDMFASDDEFEKQMNKIKESKRIENVVQINEKNENKMLVENWDDEEGYYKFNIGELFASKYQIINENGKGVFSSVICCTNIETREKVAIKVLRNKEKMKEEGRKEIKVLEEIQKKDPQNNSHCVSILDHFTYRQHLCIVFPYMSMNLRDCLRKYGVNIGLSFKAVHSFAKQLFLSLRLTASLNLIHADLKPDNILIKEDPKTEIYLSDFGSAFHSNDIENRPTPYLVSRYYRAPEVILGFKPTPAIDVWSAGCVLIELFTGTPLFIGNTNNEMVKYFQDYKGPFSHRLIKKHITAYEDLGRAPLFNSNYEFLLLTQDPVTSEMIIKPDLYTTPRRSIEKLVMQHKHHSDDKIELKNFIDFLEQCFTLDPEKRMTAHQAFEHPYLK